MRLFLVGMVVVAGALMNNPAAAKAYFAPKEEMVEKSPYIAVVRIHKVTPVQVQGNSWTYRQQAVATVEQTLKGRLPKNVILYGAEDFICAQVHFEPGRALVFLKEDKGLLNGSNWDYSVRPISPDDTLEWYGKESMELTVQPLEKVLQEVNTLVIRLKR